MKMGSDGSSITVMEKKTSCGGVRSSITEVVLMEGSDMYLMELAAGRINHDIEEVFNNFVEHKFQQLDHQDVQLDDAGKLSVLKELIDPSAAVADHHHMRAADLIRDHHHHHHLPAAHQGSTTTSPIVVLILRMDGEDLLDFINSPRFEPEMMSIFTQIQIDMEILSTEDLTAAGGGSLQLRDYLITMALQQLTVDHGMPPSSDSWVMSNMVEPALRFCSNHLGVDEEEEKEEGPISDPRHLLEEFKKVVERLVEYLKQQPVIVAHTQITFDGSGIRKLFSHKSDLDKALDMALKELPPKDDRNQKLSKDYLCAVLDVLADIIGLPPYGSVDQMDKVVDGVVLRMVTKEAEEGNKLVIKEEEEEEELKTLVIMIREILRSIMLEVEANPISVASNSVIHGPLITTSASSKNNTLLPLSS